MGGKTRGSGNAAWRAAAVANQIKPGHTNRRICCAWARWSGKPCGQFAMKGVTVCLWHGGRLFQKRKRILEAKYAAAQKPFDSASRKLAGVAKKSARELPTVSQGGGKGGAKVGAP